MKTIPFNLDKCKEITTHFPTPFYLYDEKAIVDNIHRLQKAFSWNKSFREYFAVKTTPNPHILKLFKENNCGVECCSIAELLLANACGFTGSDIMFTSNVTSLEEFRCARKLNGIINLDDISHIEYMRKEDGIPELICCRLTPDRPVTYEGKTVMNYEDSKFGFTKEQLISGLTTLKQYGAKSFGIHTQFGCHRTEAKYFGQNASLFFQDIADIYRITGIKPAFINLAGGIGISYQEETPEPDIFEISKEIQTAYQNYLIPAGLEEIPLYLELGIFMTGRYGYFVSTVLHVKETYRNFIGLDASTNSFMSPLRYNNYHEITVLGKEGEGNFTSYDITGALCENRDKFGIQRQLPKTYPGDILVFHDAGAYSYCQATNFNGRLRPAELLLCADNTIRQIRRAETLNDYFTTLDYKIDTSLMDNEN
jgi:diaminopimelate decarboxylase